MPSRNAAALLVNPFPPARPSKRRVRRNKDYEEQEDASLLEGQQLSQRAPAPPPRSRIQPRLEQLEHGAFIELTMRLLQLCDRLGGDLTANFDHAPAAPQRRPARLENGKPPPHPNQQWLWDRATSGSSSSLGSSHSSGQRSSRNTAMRMRGHSHEDYDEAFEVDPTPRVLAPYDGGITPATQRRTEGENSPIPVDATDGGHITPRRLRPPSARAPAASNPMRHAPTSHHRSPVGVQPHKQLQAVRDHESLPARAGSPTTTAQGGVRSGGSEGRQELSAA